MYVSKMQQKINKTLLKIIDLSRVNENIYKTNIISFEVKQEGYSKLKQKLRGNN